MEEKKFNRERRVRDRFCCGEVQVREREDGGESRTITGRAVVFNSPSAPLLDNEDMVVREIISPEAITMDVLDASDVKMTMFHDRQLILARSNNGVGTLTYGVDADGVTFEFEAPHTVDGDKALELVRRGDIAGCSFAFSTYYYDTDWVSKSESKGADGRREVVYTVEKVLGIHDFTLAADPAYPTTAVDARELTERMEQKNPPMQEQAWRAQVQDMRAVLRKRQ